MVRRLGKHAKLVVASGQNATPHPPTGADIMAIYVFRRQARNTDIFIRICSTSLRIEVIVANTDADTI